MLVDGPPEPAPLAADARRHLIEVPRPAAPHLVSAQLVRGVDAELRDPAPHRLIARPGAALGEQLLDIPEAQREAEVEPDGVSNPLRREAVPMVEAGPGQPRNLLRVAGQVREYHRPGAEPAARAGTSLPNGRVAAVLDHLVAIPRGAQRATVRRRAGARLRPSARRGSFRSSQTSSAHSDGAVRSPPMSGAPAG